jgi:hypothetical protein
MKICAFLAGIAALLMGTGAAGAGTIPPKTALEFVAEIPVEFRGAWCETKNPKIMTRCRKPLDEGDIEITATVLKLADTNCRQDKIFVSRDRKYLSLRAWCGTEANPDDWMGGFQMWLIGRNRMEYRE